MGEGRLLTMLMHRSRFVALPKLLCLVLGSFLSLPASSGDAVFLAEARVPVGAMVWGIVGYTRWPQQPQPLRVCLAGELRFAEQVRQLSDWIPPERSATFIQLDVSDDPSRLCDLVYVGSLPAENVRRLVVTLAGKPVLTIGEGADFCSVGGMFCFNGHDSSSGFSANLDAISRSGLRVNPQVLRLSRQLRNLGS